MVSRGWQLSHHRPPHHTPMVGWERRKRATDGRIDGLGLPLPPLLLLLWIVDDRQVGVRVQITFDVDDDDDDDEDYAKAIELL